MPQEEEKKLSMVRRLPRKLFTLDSRRKPSVSDITGKEPSPSSNVSETSRPTRSGHKQRNPSASSAQTSYTVQTDFTTFMERTRTLDETDPFGDETVGAGNVSGGWMGGSILESPSDSDENKAFNFSGSGTPNPPRPASPSGMSSRSWSRPASPSGGGSSSSRSASPAASSERLPWRKPSKKPSLLAAHSKLSKESTAPEPPSPSRLRWDHVRQHVLPVQTRIPPPPPPTPPPGSIVIPSRPSTPKQFRIGKARLGFKQVVEQAQDASEDHMEQFASLITELCWKARTGDTRGQRAESGGGNMTLPGTFNLAFMATASSLTSLPTSHTVKSGMRRQPSVTSMASTARPIHTPAMSSIHGAISQFASTSTTWERASLPMPQESHVLATLFLPFMGAPTADAEQVARVEIERVHAIETFEIMVQTWKAATPEGELQRCIWCCKAVIGASMSTQMRMRLFAALSSRLFTPGAHFKANTPLIFQTLVQELFSLLATLSLRPDTTHATRHVRELIAGVLQGSCGEFDGAAVEKEYGVQFQSSDAQRIRDCAVEMGLAMCVENDSSSNQQYILRYLVPEYWPATPDSLRISSNLAPLYLRRLHRLSHSLLQLFHPRPPSREDLSTIDLLLETRLIPEADLIEEDAAIEVKATIARLALHILCVEGTVERDTARSYVVQWFGRGGQWKFALEKALQQIIEGGAWHLTLGVLTVLVEELAEDVRTPVTAFFLPLVYERLVKDPPPYPSPTATALLETIAQAYPRLFYKPLISLAAAAKDATLTQQLRIIVTLARLVPTFWIRDLEMITAALMSDSATSKSTISESNGKVWGKPRIGQLVLFTEIIAYVREIAKEREEKTMSEQAWIPRATFLLTLEYKLGQLVEAKERMTFVPLPQRVIMSVLFYEIRLLLRTLKSAPWPSRVVSWVTDTRTTDNGLLAQTEREEECTKTLMRLSALYIAAQEERRPVTSRRSAMILSPSISTEDTPSPSGQTNKRFVSVLSERTHIFDSFSKGLLRNSLRLFVAISGMLNVDDHQKLGPLLWQDCLDEPDHEVQASATFLVMRCAERIPDEFLQLIRADIHSSDRNVRYRAARRISTLWGWRFQVLSQPFILDRQHRRPFKVARGPMAFVATDMGSSHFILEEDLEEVKDNDGVVLPLELRKRLAEIGWAQDDQPIDQRQEWVMTPMSLLSLSQLDKIDANTLDGSQMRSPSPSPSPSIEGGLSSSSSTGEANLSKLANNPNAHHPVKRRAVFVPFLASLLPELVDLIHDPDYAVSTVVRNTVVDFMRDDPALLSRPILDELSSDGERFKSAIASLQLFIHTQRTVPPAMAHYIFNHLAGFMKHISRQTEGQAALEGFAGSVPLLSQLVDHVSGMSMREIRRGKVEIFLIPSGALWFPSVAPVGPMYPRSLHDAPRTIPQGVPLRLAQITMVRIAQNVFLLNILKRNPQEVQNIRKTMSRLVLPSLDAGSEPPLMKFDDYAPRASHKAPNSAVSGLSLILSRSYILLVAQIFRSLPRHLNDRAELATLADGLSRILLAHGDDIGIVGQALIAFLVAATRFRRLFTSSGGYTVFMPAVLKVYTESYANPGIRGAIEYAVNRFYAYHEDAFVFQSLDVVSHVMMLPDVDGPWVAKHIYALFSTLKNGAPLSAPDIAGIHDSNKKQEREAMLVNTAEDKPQAFLNLLRRTGPQGEHIDVAVPDQYEGRRLALNNLVRLFLTVIGHDPGIKRAEQFLRLLRYIAPSLYNASTSARTVLQEGIDALCVIFLTRSAGRKVPENVQLRPDNSMSFEVFSESTGASKDFLGKSRGPSDLGAMRLDYLSVVSAFTSAGGFVGSQTSQRIIELVKVILREGTREGNDAVADFLSAYTRDSLIREQDLRLKHVSGFLNDIAPVFKVYASIVDFSSVLDTITQLASKPVYANEAAFSRQIVSQFCVVGLEVCELAASENLLFTLPLRHALVKLLCQSILFLGTDIIAELEKRPVTYAYLAGIIFPLALSLPITSDIVNDLQWTNPLQRAAPSRVWTRLLFFMMNASRKSDSPASENRRTSLNLERTKSQDKRRSQTIPTPAVSLCISLQIIKVIVVRAGDDISKALPGIWVQIGIFLKSLLTDGGATFATQNDRGSEPPSPSRSPGLTPLNLDDHNPFTPTSSRPTSPLSAKPSFSQPRVIDYLLWSMLEFICLYRCPLLLQTRILMLDKVTELDHHLQKQNEHFPQTNRLSFSSVYSKPRRRSGLWSAGATPEHSPLLTPSPSFPSDGLSASQRTPERQPGYARFASPSSPTTTDFTAAGVPKIIHLGPVHSTETSMFRRSLSPSGGGSAAAVVRLRLLAKSTTVKSLSLVRATYRRIRTVQHVMGYSGTMLPPVDGFDDGATAHRSWTRASALATTVEEMKDLMDEFAETSGDDDDDGIMLDADPSFSG